MIGFQMKDFMKGFGCTPHKSTRALDRYLIKGEKKAVSVMHFKRKDTALGESIAVAILQVEGGFAVLKEETFFDVTASQRYISAAISHYIN